MALHIKKLKFKFFEILPLLLLFFILIIGCSNPLDKVYEPLTFRTDFRAVQEFDSLSSIKIAFVIDYETTPLGATYQEILNRFPEIQEEIRIQDSILKEELRLQKLTAYGINEIESEVNKLAELIIEYNKIINSKKELNKLIINELENIKDKFSVPRRTKIIDAVLNYNIEETIQKESVVISITNQGYIKRSPLSALKAQKRGGKGKSGISTREEDFVVQIFTANTHTPVLFFSTQGLVYKIKAHKI